MYNDNVISIFKEFKNVGTIQGANGVGKVSDPVCGDVVKLYLKINEDGIIQDAKFKAYGCVGTLACMSVATDLLKRRTITEALDIKNEHIDKQLGGLPTEKSYCADLAEKSIHAGIEDYYKRIEKLQKEEN